MAAQKARYQHRQIDVTDQNIPATINLKNLSTMAREAILHEIYEAYFHPRSIGCILDDDGHHRAGQHRRDWRQFGN